MIQNRLMCYTLTQDRNGRSYELPPSVLKRKKGHVNRPNTDEQGERVWQALEQQAERTASRNRELSNYRKSWRSMWHKLISVAMSRGSEWGFDYGGDVCYPCHVLLLSILGNTNILGRA